MSNALPFSLHPPRPVRYPATPERVIIPEAPPTAAVDRLPADVRDALVAFIDMFAEGDFETAERIAHHLASQAGRAQLRVGEDGVAEGGQE